MKYYAAGIDPEKLAEVNKQTDQLQTDLWSQAMDAINKDPHSIPAGLFISSLNEVIDLHMKRDIARQNHVPGAVLLLLFLVAILAMGIVGFGCGIGDWRNLSVTVTMCLIITLVILVIMDLDRPRRGYIRVSQQSMVNLQDSIKSDFARRPCEINTPFAQVRKSEVDRGLIAPVSFHGMRMRIPSTAVCANLFTKKNS